MNDRPIGDDIDRELRRVVGDLADLANPAPPLQDLRSSAKRYRDDRLFRPMVLVAASVLVVAALSVVWDRNDQTIVTTDRSTESEPHNDWARFVAESDPLAVQLCLADWTLNRDVLLRIEGDQFNASATVSEFLVGQGVALRWMERHETGLHYLADLHRAQDSEVPDGLLEMLKAIEVIDLELADPSSDRVDLAPVLTLGAANFDQTFFLDESCPLRPAEVASPLGEAMVAYSGESGSSVPMREAVRCADAVLAVTAAESSDVDGAALRLADSALALSQSSPGVEDQPIRDLAESWLGISQVGDDPTDSPVVQRQLLEARAGLQSGFESCPLVGGG